MCVSACMIHGILLLEFIQSERKRERKKMDWSDCVERDIQRYVVLSDLLLLFLFLFSFLLLLFLFHILLCHVFRSFCRVSCDLTRFFLILRLHAFCCCWCWCETREWNKITEKKRVNKQRSAIICAPSKLFEVLFHTIHIHIHIVLGRHMRSTNSEILSVRGAKNRNRNQLDVYSIFNKNRRIYI